MTTMKRALALILALIMTCAVFAGCSKAGVKDSDITAFDENAKYTYTSWASGLASNWNPHDYEDADSSDMMGYLIDSFYTFSVQGGDLVVKTNTAGSPDVTYSIDDFGNMILTIN